MIRKMCLCLVMMICALDARAQGADPCAPGPLVYTVVAGTVTFSTCWSGVTLDTPPKPIANPTWNVVLDGVRKAVTLTKAGNVYTGAVVVPLGVHTLNLEVVDPATGLSTLQAQGQIAVTATAPVNRVPTVSDMPSLSVTLPAVAYVAVTVLDDGQPTQTLTPVATNRIPPMTSLTDASGAVWTYNATTMAILRNGTQAAGAFGKQIELLSGAIYVQGDDVMPTFYRWTGSGWNNLGPVDPGPVALPVVTPVPVVLTWSKTSGPGTVTFAAPATSIQMPTATTTVRTTASFSVAGTYVLRATANDTKATAFKEMTVTVQAAKPAGGTATCTAPTVFVFSCKTTGQSTTCTATAQGLACK